MNLELLELFRADLPEAWGRLAGEWDRYWVTTYQALPVAYILANSKAAEHRRAVDDAWGKLDQALAEGVTTHFKFDSGTKTREYLYHDHGPLGRLLALAQDRNTNGVRDWLRAEAERDRDLDTFLDDATRAATERDDQLLDLNKRRSFLKTLSEIFERAAGVVELIRPVAGHEASQRIERAKELAEVLSHEWSSLQRQIAMVGGPEGAVLDMVLNELNFIKDWVA